jgi:hypothetical protein
VSEPHGQLIAERIGVDRSRFFNSDRGGRGVLNDRGGAAARAVRSDKIEGLGGPHAVFVFRRIYESAPVWFPCVAALLRAGMVVSKCAHARGKHGCRRVEQVTFRLSLSPSCTSRCSIQESDVAFLVRYLWLCSDEAKFETVSTRATSSPARPFERPFRADMAAVMASVACPMRVAAPSARIAPRAAVGRVPRGLGGAQLPSSVSAAHVGAARGLRGVRCRAPAASAAVVSTEDFGAASAAAAAAEDFTDLYPSGLAVWGTEHSIPHSNFCGVCAPHLLSFFQLGPVALSTTPAL